MGSLRFMAWFPANGGAKDASPTTALSQRLSLNPTGCAHGKRHGNEQFLPCLQKTLRTWQKVFAGANIWVSLRMPGMPVPPRIAVIADTRGSYVRGLINGITAYGNDYGPWSYRLYSDPLDTAIPKRILDDGAVGVLARIHLPRIGRDLARLGVPVVDMLEEVPIAGIPQIVVDDRAVVRLALDHLLERGMKTVAFLGLRGVHYSEIRRGHLIDLCREREGILRGGPTAARHDPLTLLINDTAAIQASERSIGDWIAALPKPIGLVACNDVWASSALSASRDRGVDVPEQVAVIGVDDDPIFCQVSTVALSSVDPNTFKIGYQAAAILHGMLSDGLEPPPLSYVDPAGVVARRSTHVLAYANDEFVGIVRYVREHACDGLTVGHMVKKLGVSRRTLERLFAEHVGHSPSDEINRVRLARVQALLVDTDSSLEDVARVAGFAYTESMRRAFKARFGVAPGQYRRDKRPKSTTIPPRRIAP